MSINGIVDDYPLVTRSSGKSLFLMANIILNHLFPWAIFHNSYAK